MYPCNIWGPTCDSSDKIGQMNLPELSVGVWILFKDMGAYTKVYHSEFNGFKKPLTYCCIIEEDRSVNDIAYLAYFNKTHYVYYIYNIMTCLLYDKRR